MYQPKFNSVLVEIDDAAAAWGNGNDESMLGASYSKGKVVADQQIWLMATQAYPIPDHQVDELRQEMTELKGKNIMWNEGTEAGTTFEFEGKLYGFIYWWDIRATKVEDVK